jgi:hypothetical protein
MRPTTHLPALLGTATRHVPIPTALVHPGPSPRTTRAKPTVHPPDTATTRRPRPTTAITHRGHAPAKPTVEGSSRAELSQPSPSHRTTRAKPTGHPPDIATTGRPPALATVPYPGHAPAKPAVDGSSRAAVLSHPSASPNPTGHPSDTRTVRRPHSTAAIARRGRAPADATVEGPARTAVFSDSGSTTTRAEPLGAGGTPPPPTFSAGHPTKPVTGNDTVGLCPRMLWESRNPALPLPEPVTCLALGPDCCVNSTSDVRRAA